jgi:hypothetical protein
MAFFRKLGAPTQEKLLIGTIIYFEMNSCFEEFLNNRPFFEIFDAFRVQYCRKSNPLWKNQLSNFHPSLFEVTEKIREYDESRL